MKTLNEIGDGRKIPINCSIDTIMGGGVEKGCITQFYGPPGVGKTNIALNLLVQCAKTGKKAIFIDTEGGISIERFKQISGDEFDNIASNIMIFEPKTFQEQDEVLRKVENLLESEKDVDLLVLDSAVALYRLKEGELSQMNQELSQQMGILMRISRNHHIAVVITNQIYPVFGDEGSTGMVAPVGGTILKYRSKVMVELLRGDINGERYAVLKRHRSRPEGLKAQFKIVNEGLL